MVFYMKKEQTQKALYDAQVAPLVNQLKRLCRQLGMPMFCTVCYHTGDTPDEAVEPGKIVPINKNPRYQCEYGTDYLSTYHAGVRMQPDYIADCLKVTLGYVPTCESHDEEGDLLEKAEELANNTLSVEERMQQEMLHTITENEEEEGEMNSEMVESLVTQIANLTNTIATLTAVVQEMKTGNAPMQSSVATEKPKIKVAESQKDTATESANVPQMPSEERITTVSEKEDFTPAIQPKVSVVEKEEIHLTDENSTSIVKKDTAASNCIKTSNLSTKAPGRTVHLSRKNSVDFTANRVAICDRDTKETLRICDSQEEVIAFLQERNTEQREIRWRSVVYVLEGRSNSAYNCVFRLIPRENA